MTVIPKLIDRFNTILITNPAHMYAYLYIYKPILKFLWKCKQLRLSKMILIKKNKVGRLTFPDL